MESNSDFFVPVRHITSGGPSFESILRKIEERKKNFIPVKMAVWILSSLFLFLVTNITLITQSTLSGKNRKTMDTFIHVQSVYYE